MQKLFTFTITLLAAGIIQSHWCHAQAPDIEIHKCHEEKKAPEVLEQLAKDLQGQTDGISSGTLLEQLGRTSCRIDLPKVHSQRLPGRRIWQQSKAAYIRVGWIGLCSNCDLWHERYGGGYFINRHGAAATCYHLLAQGKDFREGYFMAINERGQRFPVLEVLAADEATDTAIIRLKVEEAVTPLPLKVNTYPGDPVWCYSEPGGCTGFLSKGIINRFIKAPYFKNTEANWINVSTDWAPGSSGSAVLDSFGNAIGHVSMAWGQGMPLGELQAAANSEKDRKTPITYHIASRAADVLSLVEGLAGSDIENRE